MLAPALARRPDLAALARLVRTFPGLSAPAKLAWQYLAERTDGGRLAVAITTAEIGADQGTSADAGRRCLAALEAAGLITAQADPTRRTGRITVALCDPHGPTVYAPADSPAATLPDPPSPILTFPAADPEDSTAEDCREKNHRRPAPVFSSPVNADPLADAPAETRPRPLDLDYREDLSSPCTYPSPFEPRKSISSALHPPNRVSAVGSARTSAPSPPHNEPQSLAATLDALPALGQPDPIGRELAARDLSARITDRVRCPKLAPSIPRRAAWAILDGRLDQSALDRCLEALDRAASAGRITVTRSAYFVGALRRCFATAGIPWKE